jgi:predicted pyridoxine 5'-phosphate oxidase superfamily flavin-nucleotide-binding protein
MSKPIQTISELRAIIPQPARLVEAKILDHLDEQASAFLAASPFLLLSTSGADGRSIFRRAATSLDSYESRTRGRSSCRSATATTLPSACRTSSRIRTSE